MSDKREERRKRDKQLFTGLICLFALMLLCVFALTVKTAVKNSRKHAQAEEASAKQAPEPERESAVSYTHLTLPTIVGDRKPGTGNRD